MVNQGEVDWSERENTALPEPLGITILIWLHLIKGIVFSVALIMPWFKETDVTGNVEKAGLSPTLVVLGVLLVSILCLGSGLGMMLHKTWGMVSCRLLLHSFDLQERIHILHRFAIS